MSKCSKCQNDFIPLLKSDGLPYKTCDRCKCTDKKYRDKHKKQRKEYREANKEHTKEYGIYYTHKHTVRRTVVCCWEEYFGPLTLRRGCM